ncbi:MAG: cytochrome d ubiquinol oxidase subunit II [Planctomycetes bacterium]|nr:cytochrome d ubiquinol oxidase subunit II [Planctomycetota bacterium]
MLRPEEILAAVVLVCLTLYALLGGADYGGGVWDLLASGPRARAQRRLIAEAIGPVWEANHVWLIVAVVVLFAAFPVAFAAVSTTLHLPLTAVLVGIVLRGSAFVFRAYDRSGEGAERRWSAVFAGASTVTPFFLGVTAGAMAAGRFPEDGGFGERFVAPWLAAFPLAVGLLAVVLFALLAAAYLTLEARDQGLGEDFRRRAIAAAAASPLCGIAVLFLARRGAPRVFHGLQETWWGVLLVAAAALLWAATAAALWTRRYRTARACAAGTVAMVLWGWGLAQFPYLVEPAHTIYSAASPPATLGLLVVSLAAGAVLLFPCFGYLFRVFKG